MSLPIQSSSSPSNLLNPEPGDVLLTTMKETRLYRTKFMSLDMIMNEDIYYHQLVTDDFITVPNGTMLTMLRYAEKSTMIQYMVDGSSNQPTAAPAELMGHIMYVMHGPFGEIWVTDLFADPNDLWNQFRRLMS